MKQGDLFLQAIHKRNRIAALLEMLLEPSYNPEWYYWQEWVKANLN